MALACGRSIYLMLTTPFECIFGTHLGFAQTRHFTMLTFFETYSQFTGKERASKTNHSVSKLGGIPFGTGIEERDGIGWRLHAGLDPIGNRHLAFCYDWSARRAGLV
jgi:hypothetical protein